MLIGMVKKKINTLAISTMSPILENKLLKYSAITGKKFQEDQ